MHLPSELCPRTEYSPQRLRIPRPRPWKAPPRPLPMALAAASPWALSDCIINIKYYLIADTFTVKS